MSTWLTDESVSSFSSYSFFSERQTVGRKMRNKLRILTVAGRKVWNSSQQMQGRLHKSLKATRVATLLYTNCLFVIFGFPLASRLVFILHICICLSRTCEKNCHILIGCLFVNLRLTHEACLGITIVSLYCFGSPRRKFSSIVRANREAVTLPK